MNRFKFAFIILLSFTTVHSIGQIKIVDNEDLSPISCVCIINDDGTYAGITNTSGIIQFDGLKSNIHHIATQHTTYISKNINMDSIGTNATIMLTRKNISLPEVTIYPLHKKDPQYLVLKGFFRSYQTQDGVPKYYSDGTVEYYIQGNKIKNRLIQCRIFRNGNLLKKERGFVVVSLEKPKLPNIKPNTLTQQLDGRYSIVPFPNSNRQNIVKANVVAGTIDHLPDDPFVTVSLDKIAPDSINAISFLGIMCHIHTNKIVENYRTDKESEIQKNNLLNYQSLFHTTYRKNKNARWTDATEQSEFYVFESQYIDKENIKSIKLSSDFDLPDKSIVTENYWEKISDHQISPLPASIEKLLGTTLIQY